MIRSRELLFGTIAVLLLVAYVSLGARIAPAIGPASSPTPTPSKPMSLVPLPSNPAVSVTGTIAFAIRGDIYVLKSGGYEPLTSEGRSHQPSISPDGRTLAFTRIEAVDGKREVDGQIVPAQLRFSNVVLKEAQGGTETILIDGLVRVPSGFHEVTWFDTPSLSPDGKRVAVVADAGSGYSDLQLFDAQTGKRLASLSQGANLADPAWSPDGKNIAVTSYTLGSPRLLLVSADGRTSAPLTITPRGEPYRPSYSPDGRWLVYTLRHEGRNDVHAMQLTGGTRDVALTTDGKSWNGIFSPDGKQIAFLREQSGVIDLYSMDIGDALSGGSPKASVKLTRGEGIDGASRPAWGAG
jgi:Tol biopolymer transport system component